MKQLKELSLIESVSADFKSADDLANRNYAAGFASTDFIIWNLLTEAKVFVPPPLPTSFFRSYISIAKCFHWHRFCKFHVGDGDVLIPITLVMYRR